MPVRRRCHGSVAINDNEAIIVGGVEFLATSADLKKVHKYNVAGNSYEELDELNIGNACPSLANDRPFRARGRQP